MEHYNVATASTEKNTLHAGYCAWRVSTSCIREVSGSGSVPDDASTYDKTTRQTVKGPAIEREASHLHTLAILPGLQRNQCHQGPYPHAMGPEWQQHAQEDVH